MEQIDLQLFMEFMRSRRLAPERNIPYYISWGTWVRPYNKEQSYLGWCGVVAAADKRWPHMSSGWRLSHINRHISRCYLILRRRFRVLHIRWKIAIIYLQH